MTRLLFSALGIGGGIGSGILGTVFSFVRTTIEKEYGADFLGQDESDDWTELKKKIKEKKSNSFGLDKVKDGGTDDESSGKIELKEWCSNQKPTPFRKYYPSDAHKNLISLVLDLCIRRIGEKIGSTTLFTSTSSETDVKSIFETLKSHLGTDNGNIDKAPELKAIKEDSSETSPKGWEKLRDWCLKTYPKSYKGTSDDIWKLANKYCKKSS